MTKLQSLFASRLRILLKSKFHTDLTIHLENNITYDVHQLIVAMHSPVLEKKIFSARNVKDGSSMISLPGVPPQAFRVLLAFMYGERWKAKKHVLPRLKELAEEYKVYDLLNILHDKTLSPISRQKMNLASIDQQLKRIVTTEWQTDVTIHIEHLTFNVHRLLLSLSSEVLSKKLYGRKKVRSHLKLKVCPFTFTQILNVVYGGIPNFHSINMVERLQQHAVKLKMDVLHKVCLEFTSAWKRKGFKDQERKVLLPPMRANPTQNPFNGSTVMQEKVRGLFNTGEHSDLIFILRDTVIIKAHRLIVAMHSPLLEKLIYKPNKKRGFEGSSCKLSLREEPAPAFRALLAYMYGHSVSLRSVAEAEVLNHLATKYGVMDVRIACDEYIYYRKRGFAVPNYPLPQYANATPPYHIWMCNFHSLADRMRHILQMDWRSDLGISVNGKLPLKAHELIVAMSSPVLSDELIDLRNAGKGTLSVNGVPFQAFCDILAYFYGIEPRVTTKARLRKLTFLANLYKMDKLRQFCEWSKQCYLR